MFRSLVVPMLLLSAAFTPGLAAEGEPIANNFCVATSYLRSGIVLFTEEKETLNGNEIRKLKDGPASNDTVRLAVSFQIRHLFQIVNDRNGEAGINALAGFCDKQGYEPLWSFMSIAIDTSWSFDPEPASGTPYATLGQTGGSADVAFDLFGLGFFHRNTDSIPDFGLTFGPSVYAGVSVEPRGGIAVNWIAGAGIGVDLIAGVLSWDKTTIQTVDEKPKAEIVKVRRGAELSTACYFAYFTGPKLRRSEGTATTPGFYYADLTNSGSIELARAWGVLSTITLRVPFSSAGYAMLDADYLYSTDATTPSSWYISVGITLSIKDVVGGIASVFGLTS